MGASSSMHYTIGTALDRARDFGHVVEVLVGNHWVSGYVVANDGVGVVLDNDGTEHSVVRLERIEVVRVGTEAPMRRSIHAGQPAAGERTPEGAMPMPGPRVSAD